MTMSSNAPAWPANLPPMPVMDFAQFGEVESMPLSRHQKLTASFLARNWAQIPHVTHHDEADISAIGSPLPRARPALSASSPASSVIVLRSQARITGTTSPVGVSTATPM